MNGPEAYCKETHQLKDDKDPSASLHLVQVTEGVRGQPRAGRGEKGCNSPPADASIGYFDPDLAALKRRQLDLFDAQILGAVEACS